MKAIGSPTQNIKIITDNKVGKSKPFAGKIGNTMGKTIRFITIQTKIPYKIPERKVFLFKKEA